MSSQEGGHELMNEKPQGPLTEEKDEFCSGRKLQQLCTEPHKDFKGRDEQ